MRLFCFLQQNSSWKTVSEKATYTICTSFVRLISSSTIASLTVELSSLHCLDSCVFAVSNIPKSSTIIREAVEIVEHYSRKTIVCLVRKSSGLESIACRQ